MSPYHLLGPERGPRLYERRHGPPRKNAYGEGLWPVPHRADAALRALAAASWRSSASSRATGRGSPSSAASPGLRELVTWNCVDPRAQAGMIARAGRFPLFDSLRAIAAISVVMTHAAFVSQFQETDNPLVPYTGRLEVGRLDLLPDQRLPALPPVRATPTSTPVRSRATGPYAWRRFLRIAPAYWVALTVTGLVVGLPLLFTSGGWPLYYGFAQIYDPTYVLGGLSQAWTLCTEIAFYAFLPLYALALRALPARSLRGRYLVQAGGLVALFAIAVAWKAWRMSNAQPDYAAAVQGLLYLPAYLDQFAIGMGLAVMSVAIADRDGELWRWLQADRPLPRHRLGARAGRVLGGQHADRLRRARPVRGHDHRAAGLRAALPLRAGRPRAAAAGHLRRPDARLRAALPGPAVAAVPRRGLVRDLPLARRRLQAARRLEPVQGGRRADAGRADLVRARARGLGRAGDDQLVLPRAADPEAAAAGAHAQAGAGRAAGARAARSRGRCRRGRSGVRERG